MMMINKFLLQILFGETRVKNNVGKKSRLTRKDLNLVKTRTAVPLSTNRELIARSNYVPLFKKCLRI